MRRVPRLLWRTVCFGLAAVCGFAPPAAAQPAEDAACLEAAQALVALRYARSPHADPAAICRELAAQGEANGDLDRRVRTAVREAIYAFARPIPEPSAASRYLLPYNAWIPRFLSQGVGGNKDGYNSHSSPEDFHAFDFLMPLGTPVAAARAGVVARVFDGSEARNVEDPNGAAGNTVMVLHDDQTFAVYAHLEPRIPVKEGQRVRRGAMIGRSGNTGFARAPHLHFVVRRRLREGGVKSVPVKFGVRARRGYVPEPGRLYGNLGPQQGNLVIEIDGAPSDPATKHPLPRGGALPLRVLHEGEDVTAQARTQFVPMTVWTTDVDADGVVHGRPVPGFLPGFIEKAMPAHSRRSGVVTVIYGRPGDPFYDWERVQFDVGL